MRKARSRPARRCNPSRGTPWEGVRHRPSPETTTTPIRAAITARPDFPYVRLRRRTVGFRPYVARPRARCEPGSAHLSTDVGHGASCFPQPSDSFTAREPPISNRSNNGRWFCSSRACHADVPDTKRGRAHMAGPTPFVARSGRGSTPAHTTASRQVSGGRMWKSRPARDSLSPAEPRRSR